jgi:hypothetical protein
MVVIGIKMSSPLWNTRTGLLVTRTEKDTSDWKTGKLNGKRPLTTQKEQKADYGASTCHQSVDMQQIQQMFEKMYEEKRKQLLLSF